MLRARLFLLVSCLVGVLSASPAPAQAAETSPVALKQLDRGGRDPVKPVPWAKPAAGLRSVALASSLLLH